MWEARQKKIKADYEAALSAGRSALFSRRYGDAIRAFEDARQLMPAQTEPGEVARRGEGEEG